MGFQLCKNNVFLFKPYKIITRIDREEVMLDPEMKSSVFASRVNFILVIFFWETEFPWVCAFLQ